jgi:hypothetical protein
MSDNPAYRNKKAVANSKIPHLTRGLAHVKKTTWKLVNTIDTITLHRGKERIFISKHSRVVQFYITGRPERTIKKMAEDFKDIYEVLEDYEENKELL